MEMADILFFLLIIIKINFITTSNIYHEKSHVELVGSGSTPGDYFGYSILLSPNGVLYTGAPKAVKYRPTKEMTGSVYVCSLKSLDVKRVVCSSLLLKPYIANELRTDSWFGATLSLLPSVLVATAPKQNPRYRYPGFINQLQGACYLMRIPTYTQKRLDPLADGGSTSHQAFEIDGTRPEYGSKGEHHYHYSLGESGFSATVTKNNTLIFGAPGLLEYTGGIVSYTFTKKRGLSPSISLQPIPNPYYTLDLNVYDYFGYSVESGVFQMNGTELYVGGAPRYDMGRGKVLIFSPPTSVDEPLDVKAKIFGVQVGSYFGASLCKIDINGDGVNDLLVGAPTFVKNDSQLPYDQGAVYVYMSKQTVTGFVLEGAGYVAGSEVDGARFGNAIADLGDINGDELRDVAIGAPWENEGAGAVYIYLGTSRGLHKKYTQRIQPTGAQGFGWSLSKGVDVDNNSCNDLAVGALTSSTSHLYRCVPTMSLNASISVPNIINLLLNATTFNATFCVSAPPIKFKSPVKLNLTRKITIDPVQKRAKILDPDQMNSYIETMAPNSEICKEISIHVNLSANLWKPMSLIFELGIVELMTEDSEKFQLDAARLSDESNIKTSRTIQIMRGCGEDLICTPWIEMTMVPLADPYIPGKKHKLGVIISIQNQDEPAYGLLVKVYLPMYPKRIPGQCSVQNMTMTCEVPQPFVKNFTIPWELELDYVSNVTEYENFDLTAELINKFDVKNITKDYTKTVTLQVVPEAKFSVDGKPMPNDSHKILTTDILSSDVNVRIKHNFEIRNHGPSDWPALNATINIPDKASFINPSRVGCKNAGREFICSWSIKANNSISVIIELLLNMDEQVKSFYGNETFIITTSLFIPSTIKNQTGFKISYISHNVTTSLIVVHTSLVWYIVMLAACVFIGLSVLAIIIKVMHECGFFVRKRYKRLDTQNDSLLGDSQTDEPSTSNDGREKEDSDTGVVLSLKESRAIYCKSSIEADQETSKRLI